MSDYEIIRDGISAANDQLGEEISLKIGNSVIDEVYAVVTSFNSNTEEGDVKRLQINQRSFRFDLPDESVFISKGDKIIYNGMEWVIISVVSGIYSQYKVIAERTRTLEVGKKARMR